MVDQPCRGQEPLLFELRVGQVGRVGLDGLPGDTDPGAPAYPGGSAAHHGVGGRDSLMLGFRMGRRGWRFRTAGSLLNDVREFVRQSPELVR